MDTTPLLPARADFVPDWLHFVDAMVASGVSSVVSIEREAQIPRGTISRLRNGDGANYDTLRDLSVWVANRQAQMRNQNVNICVADNCGLSTEKTATG
jgi:hypothetical protein